MKGLYRFLIALVLCLPCMHAAFALGYKDALQAYKQQEYHKCHKISMALAKKVRATDRSKVFVLAAAALLELDREMLARSFFHKALLYNPKVELPRVVKSPRVYRYFEEVRSGQLPLDTAEDLAEEVDPAFDKAGTYLPLGINQMLQKKYILGATFAIAQVLPLYYASENFKSAARVDKLTEQSTEEAIRSGDDINPIYIKYITDNETYSSSARGRAQLQILLALAAYGASILEAGIWPERGDIFSSGALSLGSWRSENQLVTSLQIRPSPFGGGALALVSQF